MTDEKVASCSGLKWFFQSPTIPSQNTHNGTRLRLHRHHLTGRLPPSSQPSLLTFPEERRRVGVHVDLGHQAEVGHAVVLHGVEGAVLHDPLSGLFAQVTAQES